MAIENKIKRKTGVLAEVGRQFVAFLSLNLSFITSHQPIVFSTNLNLTRKLKE